VKVGLGVVVAVAVGGEAGFEDIFWGEGICIFDMERCLGVGIELKESSASHRKAE